MSADPPLEADVAVPVPVIELAIAPGPADNAGELARRQETQQHVYQLPLYRVADRSELGGACGSPQYRMVAAALLAGNATIPDLSLFEVEEVAAPDQPPEGKKAGAGITSLDVASILKAASAWVVFQSMHSTVVRDVRAPTKLVQPGD